MSDLENYSDIAEETENGSLGLDDIDDCFKMNDAAVPNDDLLEVSGLNESYNMESSLESVKDYHEAVDANKIINQSESDKHEDRIAALDISSNLISESVIKLNQTEIDIEKNQTNSKELNEISDKTLESCDNYSITEMTAKNCSLSNIEESNRPVSPTIGNLIMEECATETNNKTVEDSSNSDFSLSQTKENSSTESSSFNMENYNVNATLGELINLEMIPENVLNTDDIDIKKECLLSTNSNDNDFWHGDSAEIPGWNQSLENQLLPAKCEKHKLSLSDTVPSNKIKKAKTNIMKFWKNPNITDGVNKGRSKHVVTNEDIFKVLDQNWRREVVYRNSAHKLDDKSQRAADVYYKPPGSKKLRSLPEVENYLKLTNSSMKIEWFTFKKAKLTNHPNETVRDAYHAYKRLTSSGATSPSLQPSLPKKQTPSKKKKTKLQAGTSISSVFADLNPMCSDRCEGYEGQLPDLVCVSCYCLFHPRCVSVYNSDEIVDFICKNCMRNIIANEKCISQSQSMPSSGKSKVKKNTKDKKDVNIKCKQEDKMKSSSADLPKSKPKKKRVNVKGNRPEMSKSTDEASTALPVANEQQTSHQQFASAPVIDVGHNQFSLSDNPTCDWYKKLEENDILVRIFRYLHTKDLLNVRKTCTAWNDAVSKPCLWRRLYLQDVKVVNWELLADCLKSRNVEVLDTRGMKCFQNITVMWKQFVAIIPRLACLKGIVFSRVPASILYRIALKLDNLTYLSADGIFDAKPDDPKQGSRCKLFLGKFSKMTDLRTLRLRGMHGLYVAESALCGSFSNLTMLKHLQELSLTSFTGIAATDLEFLNTLSDLTVLELGDCVTWKSEHYAAVGSLKKLKKLKLEYGGADALDHLNGTLTNLTNLIQLELLLFPIPENFGSVLETLKELKILAIWPEINVEGAKNSYKLITALKKIPQLNKFVWGLVAPVINNEKLKDKVDDKFSCIPFLIESLDHSSGVKELCQTTISASNLMEHIRSILPISTIRVVMISSSTYSSVRQATR
ncbi:hypothetical protein CHUAL_003061 [Chamberlinius hualienensis]